MIKDNIVEAVRQDLLERSQTGIRKYNTTLDRTDLSLRDWLQHAYEECLDQANYLKRAIVELDNTGKTHVDIDSTAGKVGLDYLTYKKKVAEGIISENKFIERTYDI